MAKPALWIKIHPASVKHPVVVDYLDFDSVHRMYVEAVIHGTRFSLKAQIDTTGGDWRVVELFAGTEWECQDRMRLIWGALHQISKRKKGNFFLADMDMCAWLTIKSAVTFDGNLTKSR